MKRQRSSVVPALAATLLIAVLLSACGDSGPDAGGEQGSSGASPASGGGSNATGTQEPAGGSDGAEGGNSETTNPMESSITKPGDISGGQARNVKTGPLRISGGGSAQYRQPEDPNVIQNYGKEGGRPELEEAAAAVHGFFTAVARANWPAACSYLNEGMLEELETLASHFKKLAGESCPYTVSTFAEKIPARKARVMSEVDAVSFRTQSGQGFLIFRRANVPYRTSLEKEDGVWKVSSVFGTPVISQNSPPPVGSGSSN